ncbi:MAG TPA: haloalkane dehalogenase [Polyangiaceae bacterium]|nr:haloalkane dehalogenase [Polyangiaceae bacterium]
MSTLSVPSSVPALPSSATPTSAEGGGVQQVAVLHSFLTFRELGSGPTVVFLHGNPLSSRVWRGVMPSVAQHHRCLAPDLIGMGDSGKPPIAYRFADHARYLDAWFEALDLGEVTLVGYDWGGVLAMDWAARHPERVRGLVVFETFLRPLEWSEWSPRGAELFRALRTPGVGEKMVLEENQFLARSLANGSKRKLSEPEIAAYYAPYASPVSRRPLLQWPREIPVEGQPADVTAVVTRYDAWLAGSPTVPKLLLAFDSPAELQPSPTGSRAMVDWAREHVSALEIRNPGTAGHHAPEDLPQEIGQAIAEWLARHAL